MQNYSVTLSPVFIAIIVCTFLIFERYKVATIPANHKICIHLCSIGFTFIIKETK